MPACPWYLDTRVGGRDCNAGEYYFKHVMEQPGPRVIFLIAFSPYQHSIWADDRWVMFTEDEWAPAYESKISKTFEFLFDEHDDNYGVIVQSHFLRPEEMNQCLLRSSLAKCNEPYPTVTLRDDVRFKGPVRSIQSMYERLGQPYVERGRLSFVSLDPVLAPNGTIPALDDGDIEVFEDFYHLSRFWCGAHPEVLYEAFQPFMHSYPASTNTSDTM